MCTILEVTSTDKKVGLEIWDKTSGADVIVGSGGSQSGDRTINVASNDSLLLKQPKYTAIDASARVDIYTGWYGKAGTYVNTVYANSTGYWEYAITANTNDCRRYFVYVNNTTYSNGISVQIGSAKCGGNGGGGPTLASIAISPSASIVVNSGTTLQIACKSTSGDTMVCPALSWGSSNSGIVTVDNSGVITGISVGTALVGCKDFTTGITSNNCTVTVTSGGTGQYYKCENKVCNQKQGVGTSDCVSGQPCGDGGGGTHLECNSTSKKCVVINSSGTNTGGCKNAGDTCCNDPLKLGCTSGIPNTYIVGLLLLFFMMQQK